MVNSIILGKLKSGVVPWKKLWKSKIGLPPISLSTGKTYNGINQILISCLAERYSDSPFFLTYKQALERGGYIRSGEKGFPVVYYKHLDYDDSDNKEVHPHFALRYFTVFNLEQCDNVKLRDTEKEILESNQVTENQFSPIEKAESILSSYFELPKIKFNSSFNPLYNFKTDVIKMTPLPQFDNPEEYYSTLFHEVIHSTGHSSRLNRFLGNRTDSEIAIEELTGEIGSAYLSHDAGILDNVVDNNSAYVDYWYKRINENAKLFTSATSRAEKAYNYIQSHSLVSV